jgi:hypothetical protein
MSLGVAFRSFFRAMSDGEFSSRVKALLDGQAPPALPPRASVPTAEMTRSVPTVELPAPREIVREVIKEVHKPTAGDSLRLVAVLQRDGRLLDFLGEDIAGYDDAQIGAAVRDIHRDCKAAVEKYVDLAPVLDDDEGATVTVPAGFNPGHIRLTGNVKGQPPFRGTVAHKGWKAKDVRVPPSDPGAEMIIAPAEVELS